MSYSTWFILSVFRALTCTGLVRRERGCELRPFSLIYNYSMLLLCVNFICLLLFGYLLAIQEIKPYFKHSNFLSTSF
jgi:hypothetical protein